MCIECHQTPCHPSCPNAEPGAEYVLCDSCGIEIYWRDAKYVLEGGEPYCKECYTEELEKLLGALLEE